MENSTSTTTTSKNKRYSIFQRLEKNSWYDPILATSLLLNIISIFKKAMLFCYFKPRHVITLDNLIEMVAYGVAFLYLTNLALFKYEFFYFGPFVLIINWCVLMLFIQKFPMIGVYALMLKNIIIQSVKVMPLLLIMLVGFSFGFSIFKEETIDFTSATVALVDTMEMMIDMSSQKEFKSSFWAGLVFVIFMSVICLMLLNLFIGIAIGEIANVYTEADVKQTCMRLNFCLRIQYVLPTDHSSMVFDVYREKRVEKPSKRRQFKLFGHKYLNAKYQQQLDNNDEHRQQLKKSEQLIEKLRRDINEVINQKY